MTSAQMLSRRIPITECCTTPLVNDYAESAGLSVWTCVQRHACPVCGEKGSYHELKEMKLAFLYCTNRNHVFEIDLDTCKVDRISP